MQYSFLAAVSQILVMVIHLFIVLYAYILSYPMSCDRVNMKPHKKPTASQTSQTLKLRR